MKLKKFDLCDLCYLAWKDMTLPTVGEILSSNGYDNNPDGGNRVILSILEDTTRLRGKKIGCQMCIDKVKQAINS